MTVHVHCMLSMSEMRNPHILTLHAHGYSFTYCFPFMLSYVIMDPYGVPYLIFKYVHDIWGHPAYVVYEFEKFY